MSINQSLIDQIVARVIERLGRECVTPATQPVGVPPILSAANPTAAQNVTNPTGGGSHFNEAVVTADLLADRVNGSTAITIAKNTVLTPSARDYLNSNGISFNRGGEPDSARPGVSNGSHQLIVLDEPASLSSISEGWSVRSVANVSEAVQAAIESVRNCGAVVLAAPAEAIACEANRQSNVKAVAVCSANRLKKANADLRPNVVCVDPDGVGLMELRNILKLVKE